MGGLFNLMDEAMATELKVDVEAYTDVIENKCTYEEADFIITSIFEYNENYEKAIELFNCKLVTKNEK